MCAAQEAAQEAGQGLETHGRLSGKDERPTSRDAAHRPIHEAESESPSSPGVRPHSPPQPPRRPRPAPGYQGACEQPPGIVLHSHARRKKLQQPALRCFGDLQYVRSGARGQLAWQGIGAQATAGHVGRQQQRHPAAGDEITRVGSGLCRGVWMGRGQHDF